jgi:exodeoxyribonuclease V gamma subunit
LATGAFDRLAQTVYAPLRAWAEQAEIEALPDAQHDSEEGELA